MKSPGPPVVVLLLNYDDTPLQLAATEFDCQSCDSHQKDKKAPEIKCSGTLNDPWIPERNRELKSLFWRNRAPCKDNWVFDTVVG
jgi:hypothetical protein